MKQHLEQRTPSSVTTLGRGILTLKLVIDDCVFAAAFVEVAEDM